MESGSIEEITERLKIWCTRHDRGLARVEWDSMFARREVVDRLRQSLDRLGIPLVEIELPAGGAGEETAAGLIEKLRSGIAPVASITGIEWAFPEGGNQLETLAALSFQRETLASLPVRQIWWMPSSFTEQFVLGVPDLDSWFRLRLHLTEAPPRPAEIQGEIEETDQRMVSVAEARSIADRFWGRFQAARVQQIPEERIWTELARPAVEALLSAGLEQEAETVLARTSEGREALERKLDELAAARGADASELLALDARIALRLKDQGDFAGARRLLEHVLESRTRVLGEEHPESLKAMNELAIILYEQGDYVGARKIQETVLELSVRLLGEEHPDTLANLNNLGITLTAQGDYAGALQIQRRVLEARTRALGEDHPSTLRTQSNLALALTELGDYVGAQRLQEQVLERWQRVLGEEHPDTLKAMNNLALTLRDQGELESAGRLDEKVLQLRKRVLGQEHPLTLKAMHNLAGILWAGGDHETALQLVRKSLEGLRKVLGEDHPDTVAAAKLLARWEAEQSKPA